MTRRAAAGAAAALLVLGAPALVGRADAPSVVPSAAQLLPPLTRVAEVDLDLPGGGWVRALDLAPSAAGLRVSGAGGERRDLPVRAAGPVRRRTLWFGSDQQGRDLLARSAAGARGSLLVAALAAALGLALGVGAGLLQALGPRPVAWGTALLVDALLSFPRLLLLLGLGASLGGLARGVVPGGVAVALAIGLASWMEVARVVAAAAATARDGGLVDGARAAGAGPLRVARRHVLPALRPLLAAALPLAAAEAVLLEATLAYLGVPGTSASSWGRIVADGQRLLPAGWWIAVLPGLLLTLAVLVLHRASGRAR